MSRFLWLAILVLATGCEAGSEGQSPVILLDDDAALVDGTLPIETDLGEGVGRCEWAGNDVCDEPSRCPVGTDEADCRAACEAGGDAMAFFAAACAHRGLLETRAPVADVQGTVGVGQWQDGTLDILMTRAEYAQLFRVFRPLASCYTGSGRADAAGNRCLTLTARLHRELIPQSPTTDGGGVEQPWRDRYFAWSVYGWTWAQEPRYPDLLYLRSLIEHLVAEWNADAEHVYLAGHSRGAAMSVIAALEMPDIIAGAIPQSGFVEFGYFDRMVQWEGTERPRFYFVHGSADDDVCIDCRPGGRCGVNAARQCGTVASSDALVEALRTGWNDSNCTTLV